MLGIDAHRDGAADIIADAASLDFVRDESLDEIAAHHFVEHIPNQERLFADLWRVLKKGGILWIRVPYKTAGLYSPFHAHVYDERSFYEFCFRDKCSLQMRGQFRMKRLRINRRILPHRPFDIQWHLFNRAPDLARRLLRFIAVEQDIDGRERSKIGVRDEIECWLEKI